MSSFVNHLYYGDNLDVLRRHIPTGSVDLVYLDPPFNSNRGYNVLFEEREGTDSASQIKAFEDTWQWDDSAAQAYKETLDHGGEIAIALRSLRIMLRTTNMMAYLSMMASRLIELHRVLRDTGSLYLHCDPTASHYLKFLLDAVFGPQNYRSEIIWKRSTAHSDTKQGRRLYGRIHDVILFYTKSDSWTWNSVHSSYDAQYVKTKYRYTEPATGRRYRLDNLTGPGGAGKGNPAYEVMGVTRHWRYSRERMERLIEEGRVVQTSPGTVPQFKRYLDEMPGVPLQDLWTDIDPINSRAAERLGYPTQKPVRLLERIVSASSNPGDIVLDPFCGCGTAIAAAQRLGRNWIGIDITHLAVALMKHRLMENFGPDIEYAVVGEPVTSEDAARLASEDPYQFQWWALGLVGARPVDQKKGADQGIDGRLYFHDEGASGPTKQIILQVKAGRNVHVSAVRDLGHVVSRENAQVGVLITLVPPTKAMRAEVAGAGYYTSPINGIDYPRLQLLTVEELLNGKGIAYPASMGANVSFAKRPTPRGTKPELDRLF